MKPCLTLTCLIACLWPASAHAHAVSNGYLALTLSGAHVSGELRVVGADLDAAIGIDRDADGRVDDADLGAARAAIERYLLSRLELSNRRGACPLRASSLHQDGAFVVLGLAGDCAGERELRYDLFFEHDRSHQAHLRVQGDERVEHVFSHEQRRLALTRPGPLAAFLRYVALGVQHILIGADHVLFLLTLLLGAVVRREQGRLAPAASARAALLGVARVVTAFTLAHSLTLGLTALGVVSPSGRWVESAIALSIVLAAVNNVWPLVTRRLWLLALVFGTVHGFGFAGVLTELGLPRGQRLGALLGFNLGVELGQLALVGAAFPAVVWLWRRPRYLGPVFVWSSGLVAVVGAAWAVDRATSAEPAERPPVASAGVASACPALPALGRAGVDVALMGASATDARAALERACAGDLEGAAPLLSRLAAAEPALATAELGAVLRAHAELEVARGERRHAEALLGRAAALWRELGWRRELAETLARAAELALDDERWADVYRLYQEARALHEALGDGASLAQDLSRLGDVLVSAADTREARKLYERAREVHERLGDRGGEARQYRNLAIVARLDADPTAAAQMYRRAIQIERELGELPELGADLAALARVHLGLGEHAEAEALFEQAIEVESRLGRSRFLVRGYNQLGNLHQLRGDLGAAERMYREALRRGDGDPAEAANAWANLARVQQLLDRPAQARAMYERSLALFEQSGASSKVYRVRALLASLGRQQPGP